jgi:hypothetical protein
LIISEFSGTHGGFQDSSQFAFSKELSQSDLHNPSELLISAAIDLTGNIISSQELANTQRIEETLMIQGSFPGQSIINIEASNDLVISNIGFRNSLSLPDSLEILQSNILFPDSSIFGFSKELLQSDVNNPSGLLISDEALATGNIVSSKEFENTQVIEGTASLQASLPGQGTVDIPASISLIISNVGFGDSLSLADSLGIAFTSAVFQDSSQFAFSKPLLQSDLYNASEFLISDALDLTGNIVSSQELANTQRIEETASFQASFPGQSTINIEASISLIISNLKFRDSLTHADSLGLSLTTAVFQDSSQFAFSKPLLQSNLYNASEFLISDALNLTGNIVSSQELANTQRIEETASFQASFPGQSTLNIQASNNLVISNVGFRNSLSLPDSLEILQSNILFPDSSIFGFSKELLQSDVNNPSGLLISDEALATGNIVSSKEFENTQVIEGTASLKHHFPDKERWIFQQALV